MNKRIALTVLMAALVSFAAFAGGAPEGEAAEALEAAGAERVELTGVFSTDATGDPILTVGDRAYPLGIPPVAIDEEIISEGDRVTVDGYLMERTNRLGETSTMLHPVTAEVDGTVYVLPGPQGRLAGRAAMGDRFGDDGPQGRGDFGPGGRDVGPGAGNPGFRGNTGPGGAQMGPRGAGVGGRR